MGHIGDPITTSVPPAGTRPWVTTINTLLQEYKDRLSEDVRASAVTWNTASVDLNGTAILNTSQVTLVQVDTVPTDVGSVVYSAGDFYVVTASGTVQLTSGGALNAASIGGIGGDYGAPGVTASFEYDDASSRFIAYQNPAGPTYADVEMSRLLLVSTVDGTSVVTVSTEATNSYPVTLPADLPGDVALLSWDASGFISTSAAIGVSPTFATDVIFSGASRIQHPVRAIPVSVAGAKTVTGAFTYSAAGFTSGTAGITHLPLQVREGQRLTGLQIKGARQGGNAGTLAASLAYSSGGVETVLVTVTSPGGVTAWATLTSGAITHDVAGDRSYYVKLETSGNNNSLVYSATAYADRT